MRASLIAPVVVVLLGAACDHSGIPFTPNDASGTATDATAASLDMTVPRACQATVVVSDGTSTKSPCEVMAWGPDPMGNLYLEVWNEGSIIRDVMFINFLGVRKAMQIGVYHLGDFPVSEKLYVRFEKSNPFSYFAPMGGQGQMTLVLDSYEPDAQAGIASSRTHGSLNATLPGSLPGTMATLQITF